MTSTINIDDTDTFPIITDAGVAATLASDGTPGEWQVGDIVAGRFVLQQRLGEGRYGPVFGALDRALSDALIGIEHHVALEELPPRLAKQTTFIERLEQLRFHPQSWSHPNIAKVLEVGRDGAKYFICAQLLDGASLRVVLDASAPDALEEHEVLGIVRYVGDALNYAHAKGIIHGDLRPENVFVTAAYEIKLTGFLPNVEPRPTPVFAEDQSTGCQPHPSDDVYGLACLAYELLTRRHPYDGKTPLEALRAGLTAHPVLNLSPPRWQALSRGIALRRERRTATIAELLAGLGVTGVETLNPKAKNVETTAPPREAALAEVTEWPAITPVAPEWNSPRFAASPAVASPAFEEFTAPADRFPEIHAEPTARLARGRRGMRRASPIRTVLGLVFAAGFATFAYLNHSWLRAQAAGLIEIASALVLPQSVPSAAVPAATEPAATPLATETAPPAPPLSASAPAPEPETGTSTSAPTPSELPAPVHAAPQQPAAAAVGAAASPRFVFADRTLTVNESEGSVRLVVRRTGSLEEEVNVVWWTTDGTAVADEDYAVLGARVARFASGEDTQVLHVPLIADSLPEQRESFVVNLGTERAGEAAAQLEVIVLDDDR